MTFAEGYFPVIDEKSYSIKVLLPCSHSNLGHSPCNPKGNCFLGKNGLEGRRGNCTLCDKGYEGRLCSKCACKARDSCYFRSHAQCIQCQEYTIVEIALTIIGFFAVLVIFAVFQNSPLARLLLTIALVVLALSLNANSWLYFNLLLIFIVLVPLTSSGTSSGLIKIAILYFQTISSIMPSFLIRKLSTLFSTINLSNLRFIGFMCIFPEYLGMSNHSLSNKFIISIFAPAAVFLLIFFFMCLKKLVTVCFKIEIEQISFKKQCALAIVFVSYFSFFNAASLFISVFSCKKDPLGYSYMNALPYQTVRCYSDEWYIMLKAASIGFCLFILLPVVIFSFLLHKFKDSLHEKRTACWLGYLYASYKPKDNSNQHISFFQGRFWSYFEVLFMIYRFVLAVSISIPDSDSILKPIGIMIVLFAIIPVFLFIKPYILYADNILAFTTICSLIITLFISMAISQSAEDLTFPSIMIGLVNGCTVLAFIIMVILRARKDFRSHWQNFKLYLIAAYTRLRKIRLFRRKEDIF